MCLRWTFRGPAGQPGAFPEDWQQLAVGCAQIRDDRRSGHQYAHQFATLQLPR